jgi:hypothetical protein
LEGALSYRLDYACPAGRGRAQDSRLFPPFPPCILSVFPDLHYVSPL